MLANRLDGSLGERPKCPFVRRKVAVVQTPVEKHPQRFGGAEKIKKHEHPRANKRAWVFVTLQYKDGRHLIGATPS